MADGVLRVCALYPDLMNLDADRGTLLLLQRRCAWRSTERWCRLSNFDVRKIEKFFSDFSIWYSARSNCPAAINEGEFAASREFFML